MSFLIKCVIQYSLCLSYLLICPSRAGLRLVPTWLLLMSRLSMIDLTWTNSAWLFCMEGGLPRSLTCLRLMPEANGKWLALLWGSLFGSLGGWIAGRSYWENICFLSVNRCCTSWSFCLSNIELFSTRWPVSLFEARPVVACWLLFRKREIALRWLPGLFVSRENCGLFL